MKKTLLLLSTLSFCAISFASPVQTNQAPAQEQALAEWVKEKKSIDEIVINSEKFNKNMKPYEGIACARHLKNDEYSLFVHPNAEKVKEKKVSGESKKVVEKFFASVKNKPIGEPSAVSYVYEGKSKKAEVYRINNEDVCLAFWVVPAAKP